LSRPGPEGHRESNGGNVNMPGDAIGESRVANKLKPQGGKGSAFV